MYRLDAIVFTHINTHIHTHTHTHKKKIEFIVHYEINKNVTWMNSTLIISLLFKNFFISSYIPQNKTFFRKKFWIHPVLFQKSAPLSAYITNNQHILTIRSSNFFTEYKFPSLFLHVFWMNHNVYFPSWILILIEKIWFFWNEEQKRIKILKNSYRIRKEILQLCRGKQECQRISCNFDPIHKKKIN